MPPSPSGALCIGIGVSVLIAGETPVPLLEATGVWVGGDVMLALEAVVVLTGVLVPGIADEVCVGTSGVGEEPVPGTECVADVD
jgi:hypothetical protein